MKYTTLLLAMLGACKPGSAQVQQAPAIPEAAPVVASECSDANCWLARATTAEQLGLRDVASVYRGRAPR